MMDIVPFRRWQPFRTTRNLPSPSAMEDFFQRFFTENPLAPWEPGEWLPSLNVSESDGTVNVKAELPGLDSKDIDITVSGDVLTLRGNKKEETEEKNETFYCKERYAGSFQRTVRLPTEVQGDNVEATFKNGVLNIVLPKAKETKTSKVEIKTE